VILLKIPVDSDNGIVNSQVTKNLMLVTYILFWLHTYMHSYLEWNCIENRIVE